MELDGHVNLKLLQTFIIVATEGSFRVAAEKLHRSHSAISSQIKTLEDQLGVTLFERTTRSVSFTPEGKQLFDSARRALYEVQLGLRQVREAVDFKRGHLSVASSSNIASIHLPPVLTSFVRAYPQIKVTIRELTSRELYEALHRREVDFALGPMLEDEALEFTAILNDPVQALVPADLVAPGTTRITWQELAGLPLLVQSRQTAMRRLLDRMMDQVGVTVETRYEFIQGETIIAMVEAGLGAAIQPASRLKRLKDTESVAILDLVEPSVDRTMALITRRNQVLSPAANRFAETILHSLRQ
ncbi:LysR family transcriptional regulator [Paracoccus aestuariivivens]|uniref:LysR family transcriptional regulator n=1 Tax=Paracoccus aestuariivivens TaxID=1820333 RepID=A0A6L6J8W2_9RHOB|nr:LysR family transcriptional regulator [Paracoccus aestuariivivens]MTH78532.1 LysR family transcriptional regulator [Paracoccus aestuariivivens]